VDGTTLKIVIRCSDLTASRDFYAEVLGLPVVDEWHEEHGDGCVMSVGDGFLELGERGANTSNSPSGHGFDIQFAVPDVDAWLSSIDGSWKHGEAKTQPWGERTVRLRDPDGILVTVYQVVDG
jgi:catechol 2,3-dioxygenase-like lactoylglutathione lyase family enzyme